MRTEQYRTEGIKFGVGRGIMSSVEGVGTAPWRAHDIGTTDNNGKLTYNGLLIFDNNTSGDLEFLSNAEGLYVIKPNDKPPTARMWLWE
jgi:hypothetical protein